VRCGCLFIGREGGAGGGHGQWMAGPVAMANQRARACVSRDVWRVTSAGRVQAREERKGSSGRVRCRAGGHPERVCVVF
jgi:hypothetical protein